MSTKWDDNSWKEEFLEIKFHSPADVKLLTKGVKGLIDAWCLVVLKHEYNRLRKIQEENE